MTHKRKLRGIAILITLAFLLSLLPAGMASAATEYSAITKVTFDPSSDTAKRQWLGWVLVDIDPLLSSGSKALVEV
ncbi:MAG: hypothetical protein ACUVRF_09235, partial [Desulfotomaculales bacterium]